MVVILKTCQREIAELPEEIRGDLADALARLDAGHSLSMPLSRPMARVGKGVQELRLRDRSGEYRVIYRVGKSGEVHVIHAFKKQTRATPQRNVELVRKRIEGD